MNPERLREYAAALWAKRESFPDFDPIELGTWLEATATAMEAPLEVVELAANPRKGGEGMVKLRGPAGNVVRAGQRGVLYRKVAIVPIGGAE